MNCEHDIVASVALFIGLDIWLHTGTNATNDAFAAHTEVLTDVQLHLVSSNGNHRGEAISFYAAESPSDCQTSRCGFRPRALHESCPHVLIPTSGTLARVMVCEGGGAVF